MKYDFDSIIDRHDKDSIAVDVIPIPGAEVQEGFDRIPMWVADMNFPTVPSIQEHIIERTKHPMFGYLDPSEEYYGAIIRWQEKRNQVKGLSKEAIGYENGVNSTTPKTLIKIARFYDVSVDYLFELTDEKRPYKRCG